MRHGSWAVLLLGLVSMACGQAASAPPDDGERLARVYCASCHAFPEPGLLDRPSWAVVLPDMGGRLGVYTTVARDSLVRRLDAAYVDPALVYPETPALSVEDWEAIVAYFMREAPEVLEVPPRDPPVAVGLPGFEVQPARSRFEPPLTTLVKVEEKTGVFFIGNFGEKNTLLVINGKTGQRLFDWSPGGAPVAAHWQGGRLLILTVGPGPQPSEASDGAVYAVDGPNMPLMPVVTTLKRPVDLDVGDLNGDGRDDLVICEFGNVQGYVSWYENTGGDLYKLHELAARPGAVEAVLHDFDGNGHLDIAVLMAQGDEGVDIYYNDGTGEFSVRRVLRFPPVYGSNHIALADFNGDGIADLLYANGDNADVTPILKPYHGVRIFLGAADGSFEERYFFPLHGAVAAEAADFDGDGDLDVAAIAYFPDYARAPHESFVLLENEGDFTFTPRTFEDAARGRWIVMDVGDVDGDGDPDVLLGSNIGFAPLGDTTGLLERWARSSPSILMLQNNRQSPAAGQ